MPLLHKPLGLGASIILSLVLFLFIFSKQALGDYACTDTFYDNSFCDTLVSTSDFCSTSDLTDFTCNAGVTTVCNSCSFGCTAGACDSAAPTPTSAPLPVNCQQAGCGNFAAGGNCFCDAACVTSGDCCFDACSFCGFGCAAPTPASLPAPERFEPSDGATGVLVPVTFGWFSVSGAVAYHLEIRKSSDSSLVTSPVTTSTSQNVSAPPLASGTKYNWKVAACSDSLCTSQGPWSSPDWTFTVTGLVPTATPTPTLAPGLSPTTLSQFQINSSPNAITLTQGTPATITGILTSSGLPVGTGQTLILDASTDVGVSWHTAIPFGFGTTDASGNVSFTWTPSASSETGLYRLEFTGDATYGPSVSSTISVTISGVAATPTPTLVPTAGPTPTPTPAPIVAPTAKFTITASGMIVTVTDQSTAGSNPIETWLWDFNDDGTWDLVHTNLLPPPPTFPFDYSNFGLVGTKTYTARLTVNNKDGSSSDFKSVTVVGPLPPFCTKGETVTVAGKQDTTCTEVSTAIGPISVQGTSFVTRIMSLLLGISGGIAVLLIILSGYTLMTSRDNPEAIQESRQKLLGAIVGLLFIALALVVLQIIGVNILQIPGFSP